MYKIADLGIFYISNHMNKTNKEWARNITGTDDGIFRATNGDADELIGIGRTIKAGFICSRVDVTNAKYDAIIELQNKELLKIQIKGVRKGGAVSFTGGVRSGGQMDRDAISRKHKYTKKDCDIIMVVDTTNGDCYIIPIEDTESWGDTRAITTLEKYKENWDIFKNYGHAQDN